MSEKIAIIASSIHTVRQKHLLDWYFEIKKVFPESQLFIGSKTSEIPDAINYKVNSKLEKYKYFILNLLRLKRIPKELEKTQPLLEYRPTIIHLLTSRTFENIEPYLQTKKVRLIVSFRGYDINVFPFESDSNKLLTQKIFQKAHKLHFVSKALMDTAISLGADAQKCIVVRRSVKVGTDELRPKPKISKKVVILSVGRLVWEKGYYYGLKTMAILKGKGYNFEYRIIGEGVDKEMLRFHIKRLKLSNQVKFLGQLSHQDVKAMMQEVDIYFQPSVIEGIPNSIFEAMFYSLPIVSANTGGIPEVVEHEVSGFLSSICNYNSFSNNIIKLVEDGDLRLRMGIAANTHIVKNFSREMEIQKWKEVYASL